MAPGAASSEGNFVLVIMRFWLFVDVFWSVFMSTYVNIFGTVTTTVTYRHFIPFFELSQPISDLCGSYRRHPQQSASGRQPFTALLLRLDALSQRFGVEHAKQ